MTRDATASEEKSSRSYWGFVLWPVAVMVFYVLSEGPALLAYEKDIISLESWERLYYPLHFVLGAMRLDKLNRIYLHFWNPRMFDSDGYPLSF